MPRYFFNVHDGANIVDDVGVELPDLTAARHEAVGYAGRLLQHEAERFWSEQWHMQVTDEQGLTLFELHFVAFEAPATSPSAHL